MALLHIFGELIWLFISSRSFEMLVKEDSLRLEWENPVILLKRARHVATNGQLHVEL